MNALAIRRKARSLQEETTRSHANYRQHTMHERTMILAGFMNLQSMLLLNAETDAAQLLESIITDFKLRN